MTKMAHLAGVAHNIAHHSASGLSYISPHLAQALRAVGEETTAIELLAENPYPSNAAELQLLRFALASLKRTAQELLKKHGFTQDDVLSMVLHATPSPWDRQGYYGLHQSRHHGKQWCVYDSGWLFSTL